MDINKRSKGFQTTLPCDLEVLVATALELWPDITDHCSLKITVYDKIIVIEPTENIPLERAVLKHFPHKGELHYSDGNAPDRLGHLMYAAEAIWGPGRFDFIHLEKSRANTLVVKFAQEAVTADP